MVRRRFAAFQVNETSDCTSGNLSARRNVNGVCRANRSALTDLMKPWLHAAGLLALLLLIGTAVCGADSAANVDSAKGMVDRVYRDADGQHKYVVFVPDDYTPEKAWPVILFLHGAGERGTDGKAQTRVGLGPAVKARQDTFSFLAVFPQCEDTKGRILTAWSPESPDGKRALKILAQVEKEFRIDKDRQILTGWSMGGYGACRLAAASPERWAAVVPLAGGAVCVPPASWFGTALILEGVS